MKENTFHIKHCLPVVLLLLLSPAITTGQEDTCDHFNSDEVFINSDEASKTDHNTLKAPEISKVGFSVSTGMILLSAGHGNYYSTAYLAPSVSYNLNRRLRVRAGAFVCLNTFSLGRSESTVPGTSSARSSNNPGFFVAVDYFAGDRLMITGTYYKNPGNLLFQNSIQPEVYNRTAGYQYRPSESMSLGMNYRIAKGIYVGAEFRISNYDQPYFNPYRYIPGESQYNALIW
jgi:hypothetical protein